MRTLVSFSCVWGLLACLACVGSANLNLLTKTELNDMLAKLKDATETALDGIKEHMPESDKKLRAPIPEPKRSIDTTNAEDVAGDALGASMEMLFGQLTKVLGELDGELKDKAFTNFDDERRNDAGASPEELRVRRRRRREKMAQELLNAAKMLDDSDDDDDDETEEDYEDEYSGFEEQVEVTADGVVVTEDL